MAEGDDGDHACALCCGDDRCDWNPEQEWNFPVSDVLLEKPHGCDGRDAGVYSGVVVNVLHCVINSQWHSG